MVTEMWIQKHFMEAEVLWIVFKSNLCDQSEKEIVLMFHTFCSVTLYSHSNDLLSLETEITSGLCEWLS